MAAPTAKQALLNLINYDNQTSFTFDDIVFDAPNVHNGNKNTTVVVTPHPDSSILGQKTVEYDRLPLSSLDVGALMFASTEQITTEKVLNLINEINHTNLLGLDVEFSTTTINPIHGGYEEVVLTALPESYGWIGTAILKIHRQLLLNKKKLSDEIMNQSMDGFKLSDLSI